MKKKLFSFMFFTTVVSSVFTPTFLPLETKVFNNKKDQELNNENLIPMEWKNEMDTILRSPEKDFSGKYVDYFHNSKTYYLKQDIDYSEMNKTKNIYDGTSNIKLISGSTFNGNNHQIKNRYDKANFQSFISSNEKAFEEFGRGNVNILNKLFLFDKLENQDLVNLTFDNSPFVVNQIKGTSKLHNINLKDIDISHLSLSLKSDKTTTNNLNPISKQNTFALPLLAFEMGSNTVVENSYYDNINFSDNNFSLTQANGGWKTNVGFNVTLSLVMYVTSDETVTSIPGVFENLEYNHWTIANNNVESNVWKPNYKNENIITFTPFFIGGNAFGTYQYFLPSDNSHSFLNHNLGDAKENTININNIYFNDFNVNNNHGKITNNGAATEGFNFTILPMFNDDNLIFLSYKTILLGNKMNFDESNIKAINFITEESNTILSSSNLMYSESISSSLKKIMNNYWDEINNETLLTNKFKEFNYDASYWNVNNGEELTLKTDNNFSIDSNVFMGEDNNAYINVHSLTNNFIPTYFEYDLSKKTSSSSTWASVKSDSFDKTKGIDLFENNFDYAIPLSLFDFTSDDQLKLEIKTSKSEDSFVYTTEINTNQENFLIYDFTNSYDSDKDKLTYSFSVTDTFKQIKSWELAAYQKNKKLFAREGNGFNSNTKNQDKKFSSSIKINNPNDLYFIFSITYDVHGVEKTTTLTPENHNQFRILEENFIDNFLSKPFTWMHYYWWVILIIILLIIFIIFILLTLAKLRKNKSEMNDVEDAMALWVQENQYNYEGAEMFREYINLENYLDEDASYENYDDYEYGTYEEDNYSDYDEDSYNDYDEDSYNDYEGEFE